jgi:transposase
MASRRASLLRDLEAVRNAVSEPWSSEPVKGHINRLKMLKRQIMGAPDPRCSALRRVRAEANAG